MKLYYTKGACSLAVRITINEIGLKSDFEAVNLQTKKTESGNDFIQINSKGSVPTIETDEGKILTENAVILQYLADTAKATQLLPAVGDFNRYRVLEWVNFITTELHKSFGLLFKPNLNQETKEQLVLPLIKARLAFVNDQLKNKPFLMGDKFSLPDAYLFVILTWAKKFKIDLDEYQELQRYFNELMKRDSVVKSLKEEGLM